MSKKYTTKHIYFKKDCEKYLGMIPVDIGPSDFFSILLKRHFDSSFSFGGEQLIIDIIDKLKTIGRKKLTKENMSSSFNIDNITNFEFFILGALGCYNSKDQCSKGYIVAVFGEVVFVKIRTDSYATFVANDLEKALAVKNSLSGIIKE